MKVSTRQIYAGLGTTYTTRKFSLLHILTPLSLTKTWNQTTFCKERCIFFLAAQAIQIPHPKMKKLERDRQSLGPKKTRKKKSGETGGGQHKLDKFFGPAVNMNEELNNAEVDIVDVKNTTYNEDYDTISNANYNEVLEEDCVEMCGEQYGYETDAVTIASSPNDKQHDQNQKHEEQHDQAQEHYEKQPLQDYRELEHLDQDSKLQKFDQKSSLQTDEQQTKKIHPFFTMTRGKKPGNEETITIQEQLPLPILMNTNSEKKRTHPFFIMSRTPQSAPSEADRSISEEAQTQHPVPKSKYFDRG